MDDGDCKASRQLHLFALCKQHASAAELPLLRRSCPPNTSIDAKSCIHGFHKLPGRRQMYVRLRLQRQADPPA